MAHHSGCGGKQFGDQRPHTQLSTYCDRKRQLVIDYSESSEYNLYIERLFEYRDHERGRVF